MTGLFNLTARNCKLFFRDKGMFFTSLITPLILLVLYSTFLANVYRDSFVSNLPDFFSASESLIDATVGSQLAASLLAVCCVTVAFCSNLLMTQDKVSGAIKDITVSPVKGSTVALSYFLAAEISTMIISLTALGMCFIYLSICGWYISLSEVFLIILDVFLLTLFGTALSSLVNAPLSTSGQGSAVGTIVSAGYGFICGAYMPISTFSEGLRNALSFLPGTYGTGLIKNHILAGVYREMTAEHFPSEVVEKIKDSIDCNLYFFGNKVGISEMYTVLIASTVVFIGLFVLYKNIKGKKI